MVLIQSGLFQFDVLGRIPQVFPYHRRIFRKVFSFNAAMNCFLEISDLHGFKAKNASRSAKTFAK